jgi:hypothetical protein
MRTGRPPIANPRSNILRIRLSDTELAELEAAAEAANITPAEWARTRILTAAKRARPKPAS